MAETTNDSNKEVVAQSNDANPAKVKAKGKANVFTNILLVVLIGAVGVLTYALLQKPEPEIPMERETIGGRGTLATPENIDEINARRTEASDRYFTTNMNTDWTFESWNKPSPNAYVGNDETNTRTIYFDLVLKETEELVYSSPYIPVGAELKEFALDREVSAGEHAATVTYHTVDDDYQ